MRWALALLALLAVTPLAAQVADKAKTTAAPAKAKPKIEREPLPPQQEPEPAFRDLALGVQPLPRAVPRVAGVPPVPAAALSLPARARTRLWVEQTGGEVRARQALGQAVLEARRSGVRCLLVVCGQGKHSSAEGPVLPEVAVECLSEVLADEILAFTSAPRRWGGLGALLVRLRPRLR